LSERLKFIKTSLAQLLWKLQGCCAPGKPGKNPPPWKSRGEMGEFAFFSLGIVLSFVKNAYFTILSFIHQFFIFFSTKINLN